MALNSVLDWTGSVRGVLAGSPDTCGRGWCFPTDPGAGGAPSISVTKRGLQGRGGTKANRRETAASALDAPSSGSTSVAHSDRPSFPIDRPTIAASASIVLYPACGINVHRRYAVMDEEYD